MNTSSLQGQNGGRIFRTHKHNATFNMELLGFEEPNSTLIGLILNVWWKFGISKYHISINFKIF